MEIEIEREMVCLCVRETEKEWEKGSGMDGVDGEIKIWKTIITKWET